jgi:hypothetical protein
MTGRENEVNHPLTECLCEQCHVSILSPRVGDNYRGQAHTMSQRLRLAKLRIGLSAAHTTTTTSRKRRNKDGIVPNFCLRDGESLRRQHFATNYRCVCVFVCETFQDTVSRKGKHPSSFRET